MQGPSNQIKSERAATSTKDCNGNSNQMKNIYEGKALLAACDAECVEALRCDHDKYTDEKTRACGKLDQQTNQLWCDKVRSTMR
jgi:hypothetical protein